MISILDCSITTCFFFLQYKQRFSFQYDLDSTLFNKDMSFFYSTNKDSAFSMISILHCSIRTCFFFFLQYQQRFSFQYDLDSTLFNKDMSFFYSTNKDSAFSMISILHCSIRTCFFLQYKQRFSIRYDLDSTLFNKDILFSTVKKESKCSTVAFFKFPLKNPFNSTA